MSFEKQVQDYYSLAPLIVLGSGASIAYGMPSMTELAGYLITSIEINTLSVKENDEWREFTEKLNSGIDLERALHEVSMSETLTRRIVDNTWELIQHKDIEIYQRFIGREIEFSLGKLLSHFFRSSITQIDVVTTNYDKLVEYACDEAKIHHYSGFSHGFFRQLSIRDEIRTKRKVNIWKVHGSVDWFKTPIDDIVGLSQIEKIPTGYEPQIVTPGTQKYQRTHLEPFRSIINNADQAIMEAPSYLCIGYGFNDEHIQPKLMTKCARHNTPIIIVTHTLTENIRKHFLSGNVKNFVAIERGTTDSQSIIYSSIPENSKTIEDNLWSLDGFMRIVT